MKHWWYRTNPYLGGITKDTVEDATGCIPWLLETCTKNGWINLESTTLQGLWQQVEASRFVTEIHDENLHWDMCVLLYGNLERY
jgi:hypothetical protein